MARRAIHSFRPHTGQVTQSTGSKDVFRDSSDNGNRALDSTDHCQLAEHRPVVVAKRPAWDATPCQAQRRHCGLQDAAFKIRC